MKFDKRIAIPIIILLIIILILLGFICLKPNKPVNNNKPDTNDLSKEKLNMVEEYLSNKYNMDIKMKDYNYYDNGNEGINAGQHYEFYFEPIQDFELHANLDYLDLKKENLKHITLNITDIDRAKELKENIEDKIYLKTNIKEYRLVESNDNKYYSFKIELNDNKDYWVMGEIEEDISKARIISISSSLKEKYKIEDTDNLTLNEVLNKIKGDNNVDNSDISIDSITEEVLYKTTYSFAFGSRRVIVYNNGYVFDDLEIEDPRHEPNYKFVKELSKEDLNKLKDKINNTDDTKEIEDYVILLIYGVKEFDNYGNY